MYAKPLYLHAKAPTQIVLQGPALRVKSENQAEHLYPLRYIERVQADHNITWSTPALLACAERGICIQFLDAQGQTLARLLGSNHAQHSLAIRLVAILARPGWQNQYQRWCYGRRLQTLRYVAQKLGYRYEQSKDLEALPSWSRAQLAERHPKDPADAGLQWLNNDLYGFINQRLRDLDIQGDPLLLQQPLDLARDLTRILSAILLLVRQRGLKAQNHEIPIDRKLAALWFNQQRGLIDWQLKRLLNLLELWTLEQN
jgi:hypothetical protein